MKRLLRENVRPRHSSTTSPEGWLRGWPSCFSVFVRQGYGFLFYPLYGLGLGQLFRVAEAAVTHKCKAMGAPTGVKTFHDRIEWLVSNGVIPEQEKGTWDAIRKMRNLESHAERQILLPPGTAIGALVRMAENINALCGVTAGTRQ